MLQQLRTATVLLIALTILTGGVYPLIVTAIAQVAFPNQANGSLIRDGEQACRLGTDRTAVLEARILLGTALGDRPDAVQRCGIERLELRSAAPRS